MRKIKYFLFILFLFSFNLSFAHAVSYLVECDYSIYYNGDTYIFELVIDNDQNVHYNWVQEVSVNGQFYVYYDAGEEQFFTDFYNLIYSDGDAVGTCPILYRRIETYKKINDDDKWMHFDWHQNFKYLGDKAFSGGTTIGDQILKPSSPPPSHMIHVTNVTTQSSVNPAESESPDDSATNDNPAENGNVNPGSNVLGGDTNHLGTDIESSQITCEDIFKNEDGSYNKLYDALQSVFKLLQFAAPILLITFSTVDYIKAITSHDAEGLKKANANLVKRIVIGIIIFLLPFLLDFAFETFGVYDISTCNVGK